MANGSGCAGLLLEAPDAFRVLRQSGMNHLNGHITGKLRVPSTIDFSETAGSYERPDLITSELRTCGNGP